LEFKSASLIAWKQLKTYGLLFGLKIIGLFGTERN
jgi:hypothetical protein